MGAKISIAHIQLCSIHLLLRRQGPPCKPLWDAQECNRCMQQPIGNNTKTCSTCVPWVRIAAGHHRSSDQRAVDTTVHREQIEQMQGARGFSALFWDAPLNVGIIIGTINSCSFKANTCVAIISGGSVDGLLAPPMLPGRSRAQRSRNVSSA